VTLPGGYGTFEELFEVLAWAHLGLVRGPIVVLNAHGYYDALAALLDGAVAAGFVSTQQRTILSVESRVASVLSRLKAALNLEGPPIL
jgi:uncharacterized protein (TIGR00730 family)